LSSRYSTNQIQKAAEDVRRGRNSDIDEELREIAQAYLASQDRGANCGRTGKLLGSREYVDDLAQNVFGNFIKSTNFPKNEKYDKIMELQIRLVVRKIKFDIEKEQTSGKKQISSNQYRIIRDAVYELEELVSSKIGPPIEIMLEWYHIMGSGVMDGGGRSKTAVPIEVNFFYVEFDGGFQSNTDDLSATLGRFFKASVINASSSTGIREYDYIVAGQFVADFLTGNIGAGVQYGDGGFGIGAEARASVLSGSATLVVGIGGWEVEVGIAGHVLSVGGTAKARVTSSGIDIKTGKSAKAGADISLSIRKK